MSPITINSKVTSPTTISAKVGKGRDEFDDNDFSMFAISNVGAVDVSEVSPPALFSSIDGGGDEGNWPRCLGASSVATREATLDRERAGWAGARGAGSGVRMASTPFRRMGS